MIDPNTAQSDFSMWENELQVPYGVESMLDVDPEAAIGMLACVYGLVSSLDDTGGGGTHADDNYQLLHDRFAPQDVESLS